MALAVLGAVCSACMTWDDVKQKAIVRARDMMGPPPQIQDPAELDAALDHVISDVLAKLRTGYPVPPQEDEIMAINDEYVDSSTSGVWELESADSLADRVGLSPPIPTLTPPAPGED